RVWSSRISWPALAARTVADARAGLGRIGLFGATMQLVSQRGLVLDDADGAAALALNLADEGLEAARAVGSGKSGFMPDLDRRRNAEQLVGFAASRGYLQYLGHG